LRAPLVLTCEIPYREAARAFAFKWLPAWSGNDPELLASFYSDDTYHLDPAMPSDVRGKTALLAYFRTLLGYNPNWVWSQLEGIPLEDGFLLQLAARSEERALLRWNANASVCCNAL
jgi:hypothetical protein